VTYVLKFVLYFLTVFLTLFVFLGEGEVPVQPMQVCDVNFYQYQYLIKAELRQSFSACVYCMQLRFQNTYLGLLKQTKQTRVITLKTQLHAVNAR